MILDPLCQSWYRLDDRGVLLALPVLEARLSGRARLPLQNEDHLGHCHSYEGIAAGPSCARADPAYKTVRLTHRILRTMENRASLGYAIAQGLPKLATKLGAGMNAAGSVRVG